MTAEPSSKAIFVKAAGRSLAARWLRPGGRIDPADDSALVFLHEGLGSIAQWKGFPAALAEETGLPALIYERWGFGRSEPLELPRPRDYMHREAEQALPEVLAACGIERPILVGHSDGGTIALLYAAAYPERPLACITEAAHVFVEQETIDGIRDAADLWVTGDLKARLARYHGEQTEAMFRGWAETWLRPDFRDWNMLDRLPSITCPLLVIQGADDPYGTTAQVEAIAGGASGRAEVLKVPDCGHAPHAEQRKLVLASMAASCGILLGHAATRREFGRALRARAARSDGSHS